VVLLATDALVSREQLPGLELGDGLGQWKQTQLEDLFIAQPGLYWTKRAAKTRGFSPKVFLSHVPEIEASWDGWIARGGTNSPAWWRRLPKYKIAVEAFISLRAGTRQGKQPGRWEWPEKTLDFLWHNKRRLGDAVTEGMAVATWPLPGRRGAGSAVYDWDEETVSEQNELDMLTEGNPDALDWSPPGFTSN
jgi:hypothetical protein